RATAGSSPRSRTCSRSRTSAAGISSTRRSSVTPTGSSPRPSRPHRGEAHLSTRTLERAQPDRPESLDSGRSPALRGLLWGRWGLRATALLYRGLMVALPLAAIAWTGFRDGFAALGNAFRAPGARQALQLTLLSSAGVALVNGIFGTLLAYVLVRFRFP